MTEILRYSLIGEEDIAWGNGTFPVTLADGRQVTLRQVNLGAINVQRQPYGAAGDGVTDDTNSLRRAFADGASLGIPVFLPAGTYRVTPSIASSTPAAHIHAFELQSNLHIIGAGEGLTILKTSPGVSGDNGVTVDGAPQWFGMFWSASTLSNISFRHLTFDNNGMNNPYSPSRAAYTFSSAVDNEFIGFFGANGAGSDVTIEYCTFQNQAGRNNIICGFQPVGGVIGKRWKICHTTHLDLGLDAGDSTAIFGVADDMEVSNNFFYNTTAIADYRGPGARTAHEVHGSNHVVAHNHIRNYGGGIIVTSNFTSPTKNVVVAHNTFDNAAFTCITFTREDDGAANIQQAISNVDVHDNVGTFATALYATAATEKAGIIFGLAAAYSITDVAIHHNRFIAPPSMANISAGISIITPTNASQDHDRIAITDNEFTGGYQGIVIQVPAGGAGSTIKTLTIRRNRTYDLLDVGANATPSAIVVATSTGPAIPYLVIEDNLAHDNVGGAGHTDNGVFISGPVTELLFGRNHTHNVATPFNEVAATITTRTGDYENIAYTPTITGSGGGSFSLGNGTLVGRYSAVANTVLVNYLLTVGATTSWPVGTLEFTVPLDCQNDGSDYYGVWRIENGGAFQLGTAQLLSSTSLIALNIQGGSNVTSTSPVALVAGDLLSITVSYARV